VIEDPKMLSVMLIARLLRAHKLRISKLPTGAAGGTD
jgi:hypothetical protein